MQKSNFDWNQFKLPTLHKNMYCASQFFIIFDFYSYTLRIEAMKVRLEYSERQTELKQVIDTLRMAISG